MIRLIGLALVMWLLSEAGLAGSTADTDACSSCAARHKSLQLLQAARDKDRDGKAPEKIPKSVPGAGRIEDRPPVLDIQGPAVSPPPKK